MADSALRMFWECRRVWSRPKLWCQNLSIDSSTYIEKKMAITESPRQIARIWSYYDIRKFSIYFNIETLLLRHEHWADLNYNVVRSGPVYIHLLRHFLSRSGRHGFKCRTWTWCQHMLLTWSASREVNKECTCLHLLTWPHFVKIAKTHGHKDLGTGKHI